VPPLKGVIFTESAGSTLTVAVDVVRLDPTVLDGQDLDGQDLEGQDLDGHDAPPPLA
jgi:hypothetical protein